MIDTHCHLTDPRLGSQLPAVLNRAAANGVTQFITIGTDLTDSRRAVDLCRQHSQICCAVGIHPNYSQNVTLADLPALRDIQADPSVLALGEMGLDYFHHYADRAWQHQVFEIQLVMADELGRPVVIHSREAIDDTLAHLRNFPKIKAVFHCFTGSIAEAEKILAAGYLLGFTGPITYKKSDDLRQIVRTIPQERMLIETDSPYLTPEPMRKQKTNEPAFVRHVAEMIGQIRGWTLEQTDTITRANALRLFGWKS